MPSNLTRTLKISDRVESTVRRAFSIDDALNESEVEALAGKATTTAENVRCIYRKLRKSIQSAVPDRFLTELDAKHQCALHAAKRARFLTEVGVAVTDEQKLSALCANADTFLSRCDLIKTMLLSTHYFSENFIADILPIVSSWFITAEQSQTQTTLVMLILGFFRYLVDNAGLQPAALTVDVLRSLDNLRKHTCVEIARVSAYLCQTGHFPEEAAERSRRTTTRVKAEQKAGATMIRWDYETAQKNFYKRPKNMIKEPMHVHDANSPFPPIERWLEEVRQAEAAYGKGVMSRKLDSFGGLLKNHKEMCRISMEDVAKMEADIDFYPPPYSAAYIAQLNHPKANKRPGVGQESVVRDAKVKSDNKTEYHQLKDIPQTPASPSIEPDTEAPPIAIIPYLPEDKWDCLEQNEALVRAGLRLSPRYVFHPLLLTTQS